MLEAPLIRIEPLAGPPIEPASYDVVCVTSPNSPRLLLDRVGGDARRLAGLDVAAIGPGTAAALREAGIVADIVAERYVAEGLLEALQGRVEGQRFLIARAEEARDTLPEGLRAAGAKAVDVVALYRTVAERPAGVDAAAADLVTFTSSSTVRAFVDAYPRRRPGGGARRLDRPGDDRDDARARRRRSSRRPSSTTSTASSRRSSRPRPRSARPVRLLAAVAIGGAAGTLLRAALVEAIPRDPGHWPWATLAANVAGALVLGLVARRVADPAGRGLLGAGFCGGLTTFSTLQLELYDLFDAGEPALAATYAAVSVAAGLIAIRLGERLGGPA